MALVIADRVHETTTTTGTGTLTTLGALTTFITFLAGVGSGNITFYCVVNQSANEWEVGIGTVTAGSLTRDTVLASSNAGALVSFSAGTKDAFSTYPAGRAVGFGMPGGTAMLAFAAAHG